ncbi:MAG: class I SAM-dependent methyltransferase [Planctomycetes bacterium]|nr:class I SAM-dependent methyltransferase [Planctomycetota bacterium]
MSNVSTLKKESDITQAVRSYWEDPSTISIIDQNLHELEIEKVSQYLRSEDQLLDIGCGNAEATIQYAKKVRSCLAIERSDHLLHKAQQVVAESEMNNITIHHGDILEMKDMDDPFDVIVTRRVLINLASWEDQKRALCNIHRSLKPGGRYIMVENTNDAFSALNDLRVQAGLDPIAQHWHNRFFDYDELMAFMKGKFQLFEFHDFSFYYFLTRIFVPLFADFKGFGANAVKDPIFGKADAAAKRLYAAFADRIQINGARSISPIQVFVFQREDAEISNNQI